MLAFGAIILTGGQARAQMESREAISLQNQILELRHEVESQGGQQAAPPIGTNASPAPTPDPTGLAPQLLDRVQTLEQQVRDMRGELDQLTNQVQQQNAALTKQIGDLTFAMQQGHGMPASAPADGAPPASAPVAQDGPVAGPAPVRPVPEASLAAGNAALARHDYAGAETIARAVMAGPRSPRQVDAMFLLGQSLAGQHQYQQAAVAYYDTYNHAPRSGRAPDALLGVGVSLIALGDRPAACQALAKLHAEFPTPAPRVRSASIVLRSRAGCR